MKQYTKVMRQQMSSKKKGLKGLKIYKDQQIENDCVLLPYKGGNKIP